MFLDSEFVVEVKDTYIYQKQNLVLKKVNFSIPKGDFVYLIGRTGSGKSSLLKTLYADIPVVKGSVQVVGFSLPQIDRKSIPFLRRKLGIIFQDFQLFYDRNVADNLLFVMRATGWSDQNKMRHRLAEVLMQVGLSGASGRMPHQLSGGEQQRLAIARALINEPLILLADEPTGNLDPEVAEEILQLFLRINKSGTAIFMATHNHHLVHNFPARILECKNGFVQDSGQANHPGYYL